MSNTLAVLLDHQGFVSGLAHQLVSDAHAADDVTQDVWLATIVRPPEDRGIPRAWLARVVRNRASTARKAEWRRRRREAASAPAAEGSAGPSPERVLHEEQVRRAVVDAVLALPEPYRTPVLLRYYEDLSPREIARRLALPVDTVKTHLRRALEKLRRKLAREAEGDERAYGAALVALAERSPGTVVTLLTGGGFLGAKLVAAAALVMVATLATIEWDSAEPSRVAAAPSDPPTVADAASVEAPANGLAFPERLAEPTPREVGETAGVLRGRCVDGAARPLAGVRVSVPQWPDLDAVVTGPDGVFRIPRAGEDPEITLRTDRSGRARNFARVSWPGSARVDMGDVLLEPAAIVRGHLEDLDGTPIADAWIVVSQTQDRALEVSELWRPLSDTRTDANGDFLLDDCPADWSVVRAVADGEFVTWTDELGLTVGDTNQFVSLQAAVPAEARRFRARVLGIDGAPLGARRSVNVAIRRGEDELTRILSTNDEGVVAFPVRGDESISLSVRDPFGRVGHAADLRPSPKTVVLRVRDAPLSHLEVRSRRDGTPAERAKCLIHSVSESGGHELDDGVLAGVAGPGLRAFVRPESPFYVHVTCRGFVGTLFGPFDAPLPDPIVLELEPTSTLGGTVLAGGAPLADATLRLFRSIESGPDWLPESHDDGTAVEATTDGDGRFRLDVPERGAYFVRAEHPEFAHSTLGPLRLDSTRENEDVVLHVTPGGAIEGTITAPAGIGPAGFSVFEMSNGSSAFTANPEGVDANDEGRFRLERLTPGSVRLSVFKRCCPDQAYFPVYFDCTVREGAVTHVGLKLSLDSPVAVHGRLSVNGEPPGDAGVFLSAVPPETLHDLAEF
ncbi:MAG: sigma-70 family RNA polymerase sigma factor [Planctomycetota bacterium JB042]